MRDRKVSSDNPAHSCEGTSIQKPRGPARSRASSPIIPAIVIGLMVLCVVLYLRLDDHLDETVPPKRKTLFSLAHFSDEGVEEGEWTEFPIADPHTCDGEDILRFVRENGGSVGPVAFRSFPLPNGGQKRGLAAMKEMEEGQVAVAVPLNLTLSLCTAMDDPRIGEELLQQVLLGKEDTSSGLDEFSALAVFILFHAANASSFFRPFLCALPRHVPLPIFRSQDELLHSDFSSSGRFLRAVEVMGKVMADGYLRTSDNLFSKRTDLFPTRPSLAAWLWASSVIFSRSWGVRPPAAHPLVARGQVGSVHALAPLADMVNHDQTANKVLHTSDGGFEVRVAKDLGVGDEISISYGDKCNMELLAHYGFELEGNTITTCEWDSALAKRLESASDLKGVRKRASTPAGP